jgi:hypothetical protein
MLMPHFRDQRQELRGQVRLPVGPWRLAVARVAVTLEAAATTATGVPTATRPAAEGAAAGRGCGRRGGGDTHRGQPGHLRRERHPF